MGFLAVFTIFRYQNLNQSANNRRNALIEMLSIKANPDLAQWILAIGKDDIGRETRDEEIRRCGGPSASVFVDEIYFYRDKRTQIEKWGWGLFILWGFGVLVYGFSHVWGLYEGHRYYWIMGFSLIPFGLTGWFLARDLWPRPWKKYQVRKRE